MTQLITVTHTNKGYVVKVNGIVAVESTAYADAVAAVKSRASVFSGKTSVKFD